MDKAAAAAVAFNTPTLWSLRGALCYKAGVSTLQMVHRKLLARKYRVKKRRQHSLHLNIAPYLEASHFDAASSIDYHGHFSWLAQLFYAPTQSTRTHTGAQGSTGVLVITLEQRVFNSGPCWGLLDSNHSGSTSVLHTGTEGLPFCTGQAGNRGSFIAFRTLRYTGGPCSSSSRCRFILGDRRASTG